MTNFIAGLCMLWDYYILTGFVIATVTLIVFTIILMLDDEIFDMDEYMGIALLSCLGYVTVVVGWILIPVFLPFAFCSAFIWVGRKILFVNTGNYHRRRRNFIKDNFIYRRFVENDNRKGVDNF